MSLLGRAPCQAGPLTHTHPQAVLPTCHLRSVYPQCPLWMSSTQVGKLETDWAEGAVAGGLRAASATANATLWALLAGMGAHNLCCKRSGVRASPIAFLHPNTQRAKHSGQVTVLICPPHVLILRYLGAEMMDFPRSLLSPRRR